MLFSLAVSILVHKNKARKRWRLLVATLAMFVLASISASASMYMLFRIISSGKPIPEFWAQIKLTLSIYTK